MVGAAEADHALKALTLLGPTPLYAAFTGVLLFASSLIAGWTENWFVWHRLDSALAWNPRIVARLGSARAQRWARWWRGNVSALASNVSLGFMLGLVPVVAAFFGLRDPFFPGGFEATIPLPPGIHEVTVVALDNRAVPTAGAPVRSTRVKRGESLGVVSNTNSLAGGRVVLTAGGVLDPPEHALRKTSAVVPARRLESLAVLVMFPAPGQFVRRAVVAQA